MFRYNIPLRYLIPLLLLLFSVITVFAGLLSGRSATLGAAIAQMEQQFTEHLRLSQNHLEEMFRNGEPELIGSYISAQAQMRNNRLVVLVDEHSKVVASSPLKWEGLSAFQVGDMNDQRFLHAIMDGVTENVAHLDDTGTLRGYIRVCGGYGVTGGGREQCGFLYQVQDVSGAVAAAEHAALRQAIFFGVGAMLIAAVFAVILHRLVTRRSEELIRVTRSFANGDVTARTRMKGSDELACMGAALDSMFDRVIAEREKLQASEMSLARAQRIAHMGNWVWDIETSTLTWSDEIFRIFGLEPGEVAPSYEQFMAVIHPDDREKVQDAVARALAKDGGEYRVAHRIVLRDRTVRYVQENGHVSRDENGRALTMIGTVLDITERVKAEEELELFQLMIEKSADPIFLVDVDDGYRMAYVNEAAVQHFGAPRDEVLCWHIPDWDVNFSYDNLPRHNRNLMHHHAMVIESLHKVKGGDVVPVELSLNYTRYRGRNCHFGYIKNIAARKVAEQQLLTAKEQAEEVARIKSEFLANMSHEIRTPMNAIINLSYLAQEESGLSGAARDYLLKIEASANNLLGIINEILDFSKIEAGKLVLENSPFELQQLLDSLATVIGHRVMDKEIEVLFRVSADVPERLYGDALRLTQILTNLMSNAIKFTDRGEVVLDIERVSWTEERTVLRLAVSDTGMGMSEEELERLFLPFNQADSSISRRYGGTGLGLAITRRLVDLMEGEISVTSTEGSGSRFSVTLPLLLDSAAGQSKTFSDVPAMAKLRLAVVDDNETARRIYREDFSRFGMVADVVPDAQQLWSLLRRHNCAGGVPYDAVIIDWNMDGAQVAKRIREEGALEPQPRIMICTAYGDSMSERVGDGLIDATLSKPFSPSALYGTLADMMGHTLTQMPSVTRHIDQELLRLLSRRRGAHILVVEDNEINQMIAVKLLHKAGMVVTVASLAREAFDALEQQDFDMVLMDIQMPEMDGLEATRHIRSFARYAKLPIVAMTAHAMAHDHKMSMEAGMNEHLTKPINPQTLYRSLVRWIPEKIVSDDVLPLQELEGKESSAMNEMTLDSRQTGINVELGMSRVAGNRGLYYGLLDKFRQKHSDVVAQICQAVEIGEMGRAREMVHSLKGMSGNLGMEQLYGAARGLEQLLLDGEGPELVGEGLQALVREHQRVMAALETLVCEQRIAPSPQRNLEPGMVRPLLARLEQLLEQDLGAGMDVLDALAAQMRGTGEQRLYDELANRLSDFDLPGVRQSIDSIRLAIKDAVEKSS